MRMRKQISLVTLSIRRRQKTTYVSSLRNLFSPHFIATFIEATHTPHGCKHHTNRMSEEARMISSPSTLRPLPCQTNKNVLHVDPNPHEVQISPPRIEKQNELVRKGQQEIKFDDKGSLQMRDDSNSSSPLFPQTPLFPHTDSNGNRYD